jgi:hypothetical protein
LTANRRHHTVPRVLLRRFSPMPRSENPPIWNLDLSNGRPSKTSVNNETVIRDFYRINQTATPLSPGWAEQMLSRIESDAAEPIRKLAEGLTLTVAERESMAFFLHVQRERTPTARVWHAFLAETILLEDLRAKLSSPEFIQSRFRDQGDPHSEAEVEVWRTAMLDAVDKGEIGVEPSQNREVAQIFLVADKIVPALAHAMAWQSLRAPAGSEFICSDNPLNIYDPGAANRAEMHSGVGWISSIAVEATLPLDPRVCLLVTPGPPLWSFLDIDARRVAEINLRTYAAAQQFIYGPSQRSVQVVRQHAKRDRALVETFRPRPPQITMLDAPISGETKPRTITHRQPHTSFIHPRKK